MILSSEIEALLTKIKICVSNELDDRYLVDYRQVQYYIPKSEIEEYIRVKDITVTKPETAIFIPGYYEQLIEVHGSFTRFC